MRNFFIERFRVLVRQLFLSWLVGTIASALIWRKDADWSAESVITAFVIGAMAALPLWLFYKLARFAIGPREVLHG